jgi:mannose-6-phosphate isomerase class I
MSIRWGVANDRTAGIARRRRAAEEIVGQVDELRARRLAALLGDLRVQGDRASLERFFGAILTLEAGERSVEILFCAEGEAVVEDSARGEITPLPRGAAVLVSAAVPGYRLRGEATSSSMTSR